MQRVAPASAAVLAAAFLLLHSSGAWSAEPRPAIPANCGTSAQEAIASAEKALFSKAPEAESRAIGCLIAAVRALDVARFDAVRGKDNSHVLSLPKYEAKP